MAKKENDTYTVKINLIFVLKARDEMDAQDKVTRAAAMLRPAGTESRKVKWIETRADWQIKMQQKMDLVKTKFLNPEDLAK